MKPESIKQDTSAKTNTLSCLQCGVLITQDIRALNCNKCSGLAAWICATCLELSDEVYDALVPGTVLKWFCAPREHQIFESPTPAQPSTSEPTESPLLEVKKLLESAMAKFTSIEEKLKGKADVEVVKELKIRISRLEKSNTKAEAIVTEAQLEKSVKNAVSQHIEDVENRKNLILHLVPESTSDDNEVRKSNDVFFAWAMQ